MTEKKMIESQSYNMKKFMVGCFAPGAVFVLYTLIYYFANRKRYDEFFNEWWTRDFDSMLWNNDGGILITTILALACIIIGAVFYWAFKNTGITVTDKRVYGRAKFGKMVDLPLDSISAVAVGMFKTIAVSTASGKIAFGLIKNREDVYDAISKLLMERQSQKQQTTIVQEASNSNADELKKYKDLLDNGIITAEEFEAKKKQILSL